MLSVGQQVEPCASGLVKKCRNTHVINNDDDNRIASGHASDVTITLSDTNAHARNFTAGKSILFHYKPQISYIKTAGVVCKPYRL